LSLNNPKLRQISLFSARARWWTIRSAPKTNGLPSALQDKLCLVLFIGYVCLSNHRCVRLSRLCVRLNVTKQRLTRYHEKYFQIFTKLTPTMHYTTEEMNRSPFGVRRSEFSRSRSSNMCRKEHFTGGGIRYYRQLALS